MKLTWLSHGSWMIEINHHRVLLDPFFTDNPAAQVTADDFDNISHILVSHGHLDHVADVASIARRCDALVVANFEIANWFTKHHGVEKTQPMNLGGWVALPFGRVQLTPALHSSGLPDGSYGGTAGGFLIETPEVRAYFACDTALFSDMRLITRGEIDVAVLPIGDLFTMGPVDSIEAIQMIEPKKVLPAHYNTWPPIEQDTEHWAERVRESTEAEPVVLAVGESITIAGS